MTNRLKISTWIKLKQSMKNLRQVVYLADPANKIQERFLQYSVKKSFG